METATGWSLGLNDLSPRGGNVCLFDNGAPLDDFGDPSSQLSESTVPVWNFIGAAADDFMLGTPADTDLCRITLIRAAFLLADNGLGNPTPTNTWDSVFVTIYPNIFDVVDNKDEPAGLPDDMGGQTGSHVTSQEVPVGALMNETLVGECSPSYIIDIPVNIVVRKGVKYWLSIVPRHDGAINDTQSFWCISDLEATGGDDDAQQYFPGFYNDWTDVEGNFNGCPESPPQGTNKNLAFMILTAGSEPDVTGACCDDTTGGPGGTCNDSTSIVDCQLATHRFSPGGTCALLSPPCGTTDPGACCLPAGTCISDQTPTQCSQLGGAWLAGDCGSVSCPLTNEDCPDQAALSGSTLSIPFDTTTAATGSGEPLTACGPIVQDIWFNYTTACDGTITISTLGSTFDTVLAVYGPEPACPATCPAASPDGDNTEWACSEAIPDGTDSYVVLPVTAGQCLLIRVGGRDGEMITGGPGILNIDCIENGFGACCHASLDCEVISEAACNAPSDLYTPGQPCSIQMTCPAPCCLGDMDNNCLVEFADIALFVDVLLDAPGPGSLLFCQADVNRDYAVDALDIQPFIQRVIFASSCRMSCCPGDTNGDGLLDALDIQGLMAAILNVPNCTSPAFCRADVNEDFVIDLTDVEALIDKLLTGDTCP